MYTLEQAQIEAGLLTARLATEESNGVFTHEEYDAAEALVGVQIVALSLIISNLVEIFQRDNSHR